MRGVLSSSTRTGRIVAWLETHRSDKALLLKLEVQDPDNGITVVATWDKNGDWNSSRVASEIDASLQNLADETGQKVAARIAWCTESGAVWTAYPLLARPESGAAELDGSSRSQATQAQRHLEAMALTYAKGTEAVLHELRGVVGLVSGVMEQLGARLQGNDSELAKLRADNAELSREVGDAERALEIAQEVADEAVAAVTNLQDQTKGDASVVQLVTKALTASVATTPKS